MTEKTYVKIRDIEQYSSAWDVPKTLSGLIEWANRLLADVPHEYRDSVSFEVDTVAEYDTYCAQIEIGYWRPETREEAQTRTTREQAEADRRQVAERAELRRLKAKYPEEG